MITQPVLLTGNSKIFFLSACNDYKPTSFTDPFQHTLQTVFLIWTASRARTRPSLLCLSFLFKNIFRRFFVIFCQLFYTPSIKLLSYIGLSVCCLVHIKHFLSLSSSLYGCTSVRVRITSACNKKECTETERIMAIIRGVLLAKNQCFIVTRSIVVGLGVQLFAGHQSDQVHCRRRAINDIGEICASANSSSSGAGSRCRRRRPEISVRQQAHVQCILGDAASYTQHHHHHQQQH